MKIKDTYSVFVTKDLKAIKDFYIKWFSFKVYFEASYFILFKASDEKPFFIGFMDEEHPSSPPTIPAINSKSGVFLTLEVEDAKAEYDKLLNAGLNIYYHLNDEIWGQRRFGVMDPNGMYIDIVQQIEPQHGFWEQYLPK
jgi:catechol 2,3-dioxygenase-like lactoylglutathione lyase family enzyme